MGYLAVSGTGEIFENLLQLNLLKRLIGLYIEGIRNRKWLLSYRNNDMSYRGGFGGMFHEKILK